MSLLNRVFVSYATEDKNRVLRINEVLNKNGVETWLDSKNLATGVIWDQETQAALKNSRFFLACISKNSIDKEGYVKKEFQQALIEFHNRPKGQIYLIPALLEPVPRPKISVGFLSFDDIMTQSLTSPKSELKLAKYIKSLSQLVDEKDSINHRLTKIRNSVAMGKLEEAIRESLILINQRDSGQKDLLIQLSGRFHHNKNLFEDQYITVDHSSVVMNKIRNSLLVILNRISDEFKQ